MARSMPRFALLAMPVRIVMNLLSGSNTPFDSMPVPVQTIMRFSPSTHFVARAQAILFRHGGLAAGWKEFRATAVNDTVLFTAPPPRFRKTVSEMEG
ncbi:hypothetical protein [Accumulibacter sp.]|uniref:ABC transporter permease n=1 Tax=Accumulibacter sp. TaxID=2053492 RepID=UPI00257FE720|nr:hypothetical protein [Accumulibacter sp.]